MTWCRRALPLLTAATLLAACSHGATAGASGSPAPSPIAGCVTAEEQRAGGLHLPGDNGTATDAVLLGTGSTGVVLANQSQTDLCQWRTAYADHLVQLGYQVGVFNYSAQSPDRDVLSVAGALRQRGAVRVFLIGASMGGTAVLAAAGHGDPGLAGVISISGPQAFAGVNAFVAAPSITVPALFIAAEYDQPFVDDARALYQACGAQDKKLFVEPSGAHGIALLSDHVSALIDAFLMAP